MSPLDQDSFLSLKEARKQQDLPRLAVIGIIYFLAGRLSYQFPDSVDVMAAIWPASGVSLAVLLLASPRQWPMTLVVIGAVDFITKISLGKSIPISTGYMIANVLEPALGAWLMTRKASCPVRFKRVVDVVKLIGAAVFINGGTALIAAASAALCADAPFWPVYANWWVADGMGILLVTPLIVTLRANADELWRTMTRYRTAELVLFMLVWCFAALQLFFFDAQNAVAFYRPYMVLPLFIWGALRFPPCIIAAASMILAIFGVSHSDNSLGTLVLGGNGSAERLMLIQVYVAVISTSALLLSVSRFDRKHTEHELRESEARFRAIASHTPDHIIMQDRELRYQLVVNPQLGLAEKDIIGKTDQDILNNEDGAKLTAIKRTILETGEQISLETALQNARGETEFFEGAYVPKFDEAGKTDGVIGYFRNITGRKHAEAAFRESEERWKFAIEGAGDGLWDWNVKAGEAYYSPHYKEMFGYADADIGTSSSEWSKRVHPDDAPGVFARLQPYLDGKPGSATVEFRMLCKDGTWKWTLGRGMVISRDADGKAMRLIGTNTDISERKKAEQALLASEQKYKQLLENSPAIVYSFSMKRGGIYYSSQATKIMGFPREDLYANPRLWNDLIHPDDKATVAAAIAEFKAGTPFDIEYRIQNSLGNWLWFNDRSIGQREEDGDVIIDGIALDISERKIAEEQLRKLSLAVEQSPDSIVITDVKAQIEYANEAFLRATGYAFEEVKGQNPRILSSGKTPRETYRSMWDVLTRDALK